MRRKLRKFNFRRLTGLGLLFCLLSFTGCISGGTPDTTGMVLPEGVPNQPVLPPEYAVPRPAEGSLWTARNQSMFTDKKASFVGDTVIVDIVENSSSKMDVNTEASRKNSVAVGAPTLNLFGFQTSLGGTPGTNLLDLDTNNTFEGEAEADRLGQITASIAARITEVLPNGNLSLFGRRAMKVDNETQYIVVSGVIRPEDITADNRVQSTYLADARIEYYGKGDLADKQKPGWGTRIVEKVLPW